jgi:hypothetical protein
MPMDELAQRAEMQLNAIEMNIVMELIKAAS